MPDKSVHSVPDLFVLSRDRDIEMEQSILAGMMHSPEEREVALRLLPDEAYYWTSHQIISRAIRGMHQAAEPIDLPLLIDELRTQGSLDKVGGAAYLARIYDLCPVPGSMEAYCRRQSRMDQKQRLLITANEIQRKAADPTAKLDDILEFARKALESARNGHHPDNAPSRRFRLIHAGSIEPVAPRYLVKPLVEIDTFILFFGDPACGKTFVAIALAFAVACGCDFFGLPVKVHGPVIYVFGEGQAGAIRRIMALSIVSGIDYREHPIYLSMVPAALCDDDRVEHVAAAVTEIADDVAPPVLIVFDTLARNFGPGDENSTADMTRFIAAADKIRALYGSTVVLVHHTGHGDKTRGRGSTALKGAIDAEYRVHRDIDDVITLQATKMKDADPPEPMAFDLRPVELPLTDDDGQPVTSAILHRINYEPSEALAGNAGRGSNQQLGMSILTQLYDEHQKRVTQSGCGTARVRIEDWRAGCADKGMRRQAFHKIKVSLAEIGTIKIEGPYVLIR